MADSCENRLNLIKTDIRILILKKLNATDNKI